jgi:ATP-dependent DNA helicase PIF1
MVSARMLDNIDTLCRIVRGFPTKPFGGLKLVMVGDFFQLPPVTGREQEQMEHYDPDYRFAFQARVWREAKIPTLILPGTHRQDSVEWAAILSRMRTGTLTPEDIAVLKSRVLPPPTDGRILTYMFPKNREVDAMNGQSLKALPGKTYTFAAVDWQKEGKVTWDLLKDLRAAKSIDLKVNAQVMLLRNMRRSDLALVGCILPEDGPIAGPTANLQEVILANGSVGRILRFEQTMAAPAEYAVVRFERKDGRAPIDVRIEPFKFEKFENPRSPAIASRMQLPLILCYAISAHKAQGQTIECDVVIDMANAFEHGQVYVMCSRVKRLEQIHFLNFDAAKITADPAVKAFYEAQDS